MHSPAHERRGRKSPSQCPVVSFPTARGWWMGFLKHVSAARSGVQLGSLQHPAAVCVRADTRGSAPSGISAPRIRTSREIPPAAQSGPRDLRLRLRLWAGAGRGCAPSPSLPCGGLGGAGAARGCVLCPVGGPRTLPPRGKGHGAVGDLLGTVPGWSRACGRQQQAFLVMAA